MLESLIDARRYGRDERWENVPYEIFSDNLLRALLSANDHDV